MFNLRFFARALLTQLKLSLALRSAFVLTILVTVLKQILFLVSWNFFFLKYKMVQGWTFDHMLLMYGIVSFSIGFVEAFFYGLKDIPKIIETGQLDVFLLQPKNVVLNIAISRGDVSSFGEMLAGILIIAYSGYLFKVWFMILIILLITFFFVFSLYLYLCCIAFFMKNAGDFIREITLNAIIVATQPNAAYRGLFKFFTFTLLPVAFLSYLPIEIIRTGSSQYLIATFGGTALFFVFAVWLFYFGLKHYESGNRLGLRY